MGNIRDKLVEKQAMDKMDLNATIKDIYCDYTPVIRASGRYNNGGMMVMGGGKYHMKGTKSVKASKFDAYNLFKTDDRANWIDDNWHKLNDQKSLSLMSFSPDVDVYVDILVNLGYDIEYYNGDQISISKQINLKSEQTEPLVQLGIGSDIKIHNEGNDKVVVSSINTNKRTYKNEDLDDFKTDELNEILINFLSNKNTWCQGQFGEFNEKGDTLLVPLYIQDVKYNLRFTKPFNDNNQIWDLAEVFSYDDPWNIESEYFDYTIHSVVRSGFRKGFVHIKNPREDSNKSGMVSELPSPSQSLKKFFRS